MRVSDRLLDKFDYDFMKSITIVLSKKAKSSLLPQYNDISLFVFASDPTKNKEKLKTNQQQKINQNNSKFSIISFSTNENFIRIIFHFIQFLFKLLEFCLFLEPRMDIAKYALAEIYNFEKTYETAFKILG